MEPFWISHSDTALSNDGVGRSLPSVLGMGLRLRKASCQRAHCTWYLTDRWYIKTNPCSRSLDGFKMVHASSTLKHSWSQYGHDGSNESCLGHDLLRTAFQHFGFLLHGLCGEPQSHSHDGLYWIIRLQMACHPSAVSIYFYESGERNQGASEKRVLQ